MAGTSDPQKLLSDALGAIRKLRERVAELEQSRSEPIAVVGMACRLPGGVNTPEQFWSVLQSGTELIEEVPRDRWDKDAYYDPDPDKPGKMCTRRGGFISQVDRFDAGLFRVSPREAAAVDPQHRILLEMTWESLEHAGIAVDRVFGSQAGVFVGLSSVDYSAIVMGHITPSAINPWMGIGLAPSAASGRISYALGLQGPCMTVDTACSSSLVAVQLAIESLRRGECDMALASGINVLLQPLGHVVFSKAHMLAPDGRCKTFDDSADGYVRSDGGVVFVLKRLRDAVAAGDRVWAVLRGGAINQDGASGGLTVPNGPAQERVVRAALASAGVSPADVGYVEAHGTGTALGDPIELNALGEVFSDTHDAETRPLFVGSSKTNLGHTEPASGVIGMLKAILQIERGQIAPHLHFDKPSERIHWDELPVQVPTQLRPWPAYGPRRVGGVSSFGFTGTNAHIVLEEAPPSAARSQERPARTHHTLCLSARTPWSLRELCRRYVARLAGPDAALPETWPDIAYSAATGRSHLSQRIAITSDSCADARAQLQAHLESGKPAAHVRIPPKVAFLFSGQGSQYAGMGRGLFESEPAFRAELERCDRVLAQEHGVSLIDALYGGTHGESELSQTQLAQPLIVAIELALAALLATWGIKPSFVIGHSVGELSAACVAGALSLEDTMRLVAQRGRLMQQLARPGSMIAVQAGEEALAELIAPLRAELAIAAVNAPAQTVLSGADRAILKITGELETRGLKYKRLQVSHAFHSPLITPALGAFAEHVGRVRLKRPRVALVSNVSGEVAGDEWLGADYWVKHAAAPVRFGAGLQTLQARGCQVFVEVGPRPTLLSFASALGSGTRVALLDPKRPDAQQLSFALAALYCAGVPIDFQALYADGGYARVALPTYAFERQRYWTSGGGLTQRTAAAPGLLGSRIDEHAHECEIGVEQFPYLADHRIFEHVVFPAAGYVELALSAGRATLGEQTLCVRDLVIDAPLRLEAGGARRVRTYLQGDADGQHAFRIESSALEDDVLDAAWDRHAHGLLTTLAEPRPQTTLESAALRFDPAFDAAALYEAAGEAGRGVNYGPSFRGVRGVRRVGDVVLGKVVIPASVPQSDASYLLHPVLLDSAFHLVGALLAEDGVAYLPVGIDALALYDAAGSEAYVRVSARGTQSADASTRHMDVTLYDALGRVSCEIQGLKLQAASPAAIRRALDADIAKLAYDFTWYDKALPEPHEGQHAAPRTWLVFADAAGSAEAVLAQLAPELERAVVVSAGSGGSLQRLGRDRYQVDPASAAQLEALFSELRDSEHTAACCTHVLYAWALDAPQLGAEAAQHFARDLFGCGPLLDLSRAMISEAPAAQRLLVLTRGALLTGRAAESLQLAQAALPALLRSLREEIPGCECLHIDLDPLLSRRTLTGEAARVVEELRANVPEEHVALRAHQRLVPRLERVQRSAAHGSAAIEVRLTEPGSPDNLCLVPAERREPGPGEIEIAVRGVGANFKDVLFIWGLLETPSKKLGFECAGVVCRVGAGVDRFKLGDAVIAIGNECLGHYVTVVAEAAVPKPSNISFAEAAALPTAFLTAMYALHDLAKLKAGESVLIHAAAGGVGQAAIRLCQRIGAKVLATASPSKWDFLRAQGIEHVMSSRSTAFSAEVLRATGGRGVDVVLNSLAGEMIDASFAALAPRGRFVEIGKRGIWSHDEVARHRPDARYFTFDLGEVGAEVIHRLPDMLRKACTWLEQGAFSPLPVQTYPVEHVSDAFRQLSQGKNVGKIVVELPALDAAGRAGSNLELQTQAAYLITGGLGDLGLEVADWLIARGARQLWLVSRRSVSTTTQARIARMQERGVEVHTRQVDVSERAALAKLLAEIARGGAALRGIVHTAGVIDDGKLLEQTRERWQATLRPKVLGAFHLHQLTRDLPLDFFLAFSSASAVLRSFGQTSYAAANGFMDALMQQRRAEGLRGLSVGWGPWSGVGMVSRLTASARAHGRARGLHPIAPGKALRALEQWLAQPAAYVMLASINWAVLARRAAPRPVPLYLEALAGPDALGAAGGALGATGLLAPGALRAELEAAQPGERVSILVTQLRALLAQVLGFTSLSQIDPHAGIFDLGIDSLSGLETKTRLELALDVQLPGTVLLDFATPEALAVHIHDEVLGYGSTSSANEESV